MGWCFFVYYHKCAVAVCHVSTSVCYFPLYFVYAVLCIQYKCWYFQYSAACCWCYVSVVDTILVCIVVDVVVCCWQEA